MSNLFKLIVAVGVSELAGFLSWVFTVSTSSPQDVSGLDWYAGLVKPALNPPAWMFGPVWTTLYALMGISLFLVWKQHSNILQNVRMLRMRKVGIAAFFVQLSLNAIWSIIFFGLKSPGWALVDIVALWLAIVWTLVTFGKISKMAAWLLVPYILWVSFAVYLNYSILVLNPGGAVACPENVKLCPDGSYVGRSGPSCRFALCPKEELIQVESLRADEIITSPLIVKGKARGTWFFEASFPVKLIDENGNVLAQAPAQAQGEWMTKDFVPFEARIDFSAPNSQKGTLVLEKDNPSGLAEQADELRVPILFR
ncbi:MAG: tryptophan-rich sensory protein [Parcubacteria group bacterium]|nr:tryptophan-rich sensory protein [Parcubacteria group bacterium]